MKARSKGAKGLGAFDPLKAATDVKNRKGAESTEQVEHDTAKYVPKSINLRETDWRLLRLVARARADRLGGRDSVSQVVQSLINRARKDLQSEIE